MSDRGWKKLCECGCGRPTKLARRSNTQSRMVRGRPMRFLSGHNFRRPGDRHNERKVYPNAQGYRMVYTPDHPHANCDGYVREHILVVERVIGKILRTDAEVHHFNGVTNDNQPRNLVACNNHAYHFLIEARQRAFRACGNANYLPCRLCKHYDEPSRLSRYSGGYRHRECHAAYMRDVKRRRKEASSSHG